MLEFIETYKYIFIIVLVVFILALIGYEVDKKKYNKYKKEILNDANVNTSFNNEPVNVTGVATPIAVNQTNDAGVQTNQN